MKWPNVVDMVTHYFQLKDDGGLPDPLVARIRAAVLGNDAKGVPGLDMTPAQVEQLAAEHDDVEDMVAALEAKAPRVASELGGVYNEPELAAVDEEKKEIDPAPPGMILPRKEGSGTKVSFE